MTKPSFDRVRREKFANYDGQNTVIATLWLVLYAAIALHAAVLPHQRGATAELVQSHTNGNVSSAMPPRPL